MLTDTYAVPAMIIDNGKNIKATLILYLDHYEFNGATKHINWENAACMRDTQEVKTFIFKSIKSVVIIHEGEDYGPRFILDNNAADELEKKVSEFAEQVKKNRLEEEERARKAEEERKRQEEERKRQEEERKRREEEERKRKAEEERKRREEEERKRKEEEERRRKAEEERKRREEEERKRKAEEERKKREALEKKIADRKKRLVEEVSDAKDLAEAVDLSTNADLSIKKAWSYVADNPYRILGVSASSTVEEANFALDKIKKLVRLNAAGSFKSEYHLNGTVKPERDTSIVQNALAVLKDNKYKWLWFVDPDACTAWQSEKYRKELNYDGPEYGTYDLFLANYLYALIFDPTFKKFTLWKPAFAYFGYICNERDHAMLRSRFNAKELESIRGQDLVRSFKAEIFKPVEALCETDDVKQIIRIYKILKELTDSNVDDLTKKVMSMLTKWFTTKEAVVCAVVDESDEDHVITKSEAVEIKKAGDNYLREVDGVIEAALAAVKGEAVRYEMIKESYRHATWRLMFGIHKAGEQDKAIYFANKCYPYCKEEDKRKIRGTFGFSAIKGSDKDATNEEWDIMGDNYYEGKNGYRKDYFEAFKWYKKAAESGNKYSMNSLGICYMEGNGTYKNEYEAARWFEKAYHAGNPDGAANLANCYINGKGKTADKHKGIELLLEAAKMGHPEAADRAKKLIDLLVLEQKMHRLTQHEDYDLGFQIPIGETIIVEVTLNYSANVYLMEDDEYDKYKECENFNYYGGRATQSPYRVKIPSTGHWHLVIDNGDDDMTGIITSVRTRTLNF